MQVKFIRAATLRTLRGLELYHRGEVHDLQKEDVKKILASHGPVLEILDTQSLRVLDRVMVRYVSPYPPGTTKWRESEWLEGHVHAIDLKNHRVQVNAQGEQFWVPVAKIRKV